MTIHFMGALQQFDEVFEPDIAGNGQADGRPQGIAAADPVPEYKHVFRVDAELC